MSHIADTVFPKKGTSQRTRDMLKKRNIIDQDRLDKIPDIRLSRIGTNVKMGKTVINKDQIAQIKREVDVYVKTMDNQENEEEPHVTKRWTWTYEKKRILNGMLLCWRTATGKRR